MKFIDEFRNKDAALSIASSIAATSKTNITIMEVCGTHTMSIARFGIKSLLPRSIRLISGPGCPVCVTPPQFIDEAAQIASNSRVCLCTFGDMIRVPGVNTSLEMEKARGKDIRIVAGTLDALNIAKNNPDIEVVFLGVGFETTAPTIAQSIILAKDRSIKNFSVYSANKTVPPAIKAILSGPVKIDGLILPGHVTAVIGTKPYENILQDTRVKSAVAGFEPTDILSAILEITTQVESNTPHIANLYPRVVSDVGNPAMMKVLHDVFDVKDAIWRGLGVIPDSGLSIKKTFSDFNAENKFNIRKIEYTEPRSCKCGDVLTGKMEPRECTLFGKTCTPENPVGACMVSSEGTCSAAYKYGH